MQIIPSGRLSGETKTTELKPGSGFQIHRGNAGVAVGMGEKLVGFAGDDVASIALRIHQGQVELKMRGLAGETLGEYRIPNAETLQHGRDALKSAGVSFSAREADELAKLMKLTMQSGVGRNEVMLVLDEIAHTAPSTEAPAAVDTGDIYPGLAEKAKTLMRGLPDDMKRFIVLNNTDQLPEETARAAHLVGKVDRDSDRAMVRFLAGDAVDEGLVRAEMREIAERSPLKVPNPIERLDPVRFDRLTEMMGDLKVTGNPHTFRVPEPMADHLIDQHPLRIPNFAAAPSFEALERAFFVQHMVERGPSSRNPLAERLLMSLDTDIYRELADFLSGKPGASFSTEAREQLLHFLKHGEGDLFGNRLSSIAPRSLERALAFLRSRGEPVMQMEAFAEKPGSALIDMTTARGMAARFASFPASDRLAFFVLEHLDPVRNPDLFNHFNAEHGLSKMTPELRKALDDFLEQNRFPPVRQGVGRFNESRFMDLSRALKNFPGLSEPEGFLPENPALAEAMARLSEKQSASSSVGDPAAQLRKLLEQNRPQRHHEILTGFLQDHLKRFRGTAVLDQVRHAEMTMQEILASETVDPTARVDLQRTLGNLRTLIGGKSGFQIDWHLYKDGGSGGDSLMRLILSGKEGVDRYFALDDYLSDFPQPKTHVLLGRRLGGLISRWQNGPNKELSEMTKALLKDAADWARPQPDHLAEHLSRAMEGVTRESLDDMLTQMLRSKLANFDRILQLDQTWKAHEALAKLVAGGDPLRNGADLSNALGTILDTLRQKEDLQPRWRLHQADLNGELDGKFKVLKKLLRDTDGVSRYLKLEEVLPERSGDLRERLRDLSKLKRLDHLKELVDRHAGRDTQKLLKALSRHGHLIDDLLEHIFEGEGEARRFVPKSPFNGAKNRQFEAFRNALASGKFPDPAQLFEGPFLKPEFGDLAESKQAQQMKALEPLFRELMEHAGKDGDLQLRNMMQFMNKEADGDTGGTMRRLLSTLRDFNQHQNLNQGPLYMTLPLKLENQDCDMELAYFKLPGSKKDKKRYLVVLHLDFQGWGHLRVDALKQQGMVSATFWAETPTMHHKLLRELHALEDRLEELGLGDTTLNVKIAPERATRSVAELCVPSDENKLDVSI